MRKAASGITIILLLALVVGLPGGLSDSHPSSAAGAPPNSPYEGSGVILDVDEFARNASVLFHDAGNKTAFSYASSWLPSGYRGYHLRTTVTNLRKTVDPVPNGDFDHYDEPGSYWNLTQRSATPDLVVSIDNATGGNPGYCLQAFLANRKLLGTKTSQIYDNFTYVSAVTPESLTLSFDMKFSSDVVKVPWLSISVEIINGASAWGWSGTTSVFNSTTWTRFSFTTGPVNGSISLRISIRKTITTNLDVAGSIFFDNFHYAIGSFSPPSEVSLQLNNTAIVDTGTSTGRGDIYADPGTKEATLLANCWATNLLFQFNSTYTITFDYNYSMCIKTQNPQSAPTFFTAPADTAPTWVANYTVPGGRPPPSHIGYRFGLFLPSGWLFSVVKNGLGQSVAAYSYDASSHFFLLDESVGAPGQSFSIYASGTNHVLQVHAQRGPTPSGPWTNTTTTDYFTTGDYLRVFSELGAIGSTGNSGNVSVFLPNGTLWRADSAPVFDASHDTLTSVAWLMPVITEAIASTEWVITVSFNTATQCGMRTQFLSAFIEAKGLIISPTSGARCLWGSSVFVNVTWQNNNTLTYVTGAAVRLRYIDRYSQVQYITMSSNGWGAYFTSVATSPLLRPNRTAEFDIEFFKAGYVNGSYSEGTHLPLVFNLVNDINYEMIRPIQSIGPDQYKGETAVSIGYTTQVRLYDLFEAQYARNDTLPWSSAIRLNCSRYEDTGSGWVFVSVDNFVPNGGDSALFEKVDATYAPTLLRLRYTVTARLVGGSCDYQQQNFTVIIEMVAFASNLDALRTLVAHPPSGAGDGWTVFNTALDTYEVHLYSGEILNVTLYYENISALPHLPISDASVDILVLGSWLSLSNRGNGYYNFSLDTLPLDIGLTELEVNASRADCATEVFMIHLVVEPRPCLLEPTTPVLAVTWGETFSITVYYNDTVSNQPITGALIRYQWGALSGNLSPTGVPGWYNVSLPTATHTAGEAPLNLTASHGKYQDCEVILSITIMTRPTQLAIDLICTYYPPTNVTVRLSGTTYHVPISDLFMVRLGFTDANGTVISDATGLFSWGGGTADLVYADGMYVLQVDLSTIPQGLHGCSILLSRQNYAPRLLTFQLDVMLVPTEITGISSDVISQFVGLPFTITVYLNDTYHNLGIVGANVTISIPNLGLFRQLADLGNGSYTLQDLVYSVDGVFGVEITARAGSWFADDVRSVTLVLRASGGGSPLLTLVALIIAIAAILSLSGYLAYSKYLRPRVLTPRTLVREKKLQDVADMFNDVNNLSRFLVLHRGSGIAIFDPFAERGMDAALFGGFLQAISAFAVDVARTTEDDELPLASPLHEISYEGFRILIHDGRFVRTALVFKGQPSEKLKKRMEEFTTRFEAKYSKELGEWCCEPEAFLDATILLEEIFHVSLLLPHKVQPKLPEMKPLTDMEAKLYGIALALTQYRDAVLLQEVMQAYTTAFKADKLEVLSALYQLREKKLLSPIEFYRLTKKAREQLAPESKAPAKSSSE